jgi:hypothetical protein
VDVTGKTIEFRYVFILPEEDDRSIRITATLDAKTLDLVRTETNAPPDWARLEKGSCSVCPLHPAEHEFCPTMVALSDLIAKFGELLSYSEVKARVVTAARTISSKTTVQRALSSLLGLHMATSGCPVLAKMKPMARFHLPFATREETLFRSASAYLTAQYFLRKHGKEADEGLDGLREIYKQVHTVNLELGDRLRNVAKGDANMNALVLLDLFAQDLPFSIDEHLHEIEYMFEPFLNGQDGITDSSAVLR